MRLVLLTWYQIEDRLAYLLTASLSNGNRSFFIFIFKIGIALQFDASFNSNAYFKMKTTMHCFRLKLLWGKITSSSIWFQLRRIFISPNPSALLLYVGKTVNLVFSLFTPNISCSIQLFCWLSPSIHVSDIITVPFGFFIFSDGLLVTGKGEKQVFCFFFFSIHPP